MTTVFRVGGGSLIWDYGEPKMVFHLGGVWDSEAIEEKKNSKNVYAMIELS